MIRKGLWRALTLLIVLSTAVPFVQAAPSPSLVAHEPAARAPEAEPPASTGPAESKWELVSSGRSAVEVTESATYIIQLEAEPVASYRGGIEGLEATNPAAQGQVQLDAQSPESVAYANYLEQRQTEFLLSAEKALGRPVTAKYQYKYAFNGLAAELTAEEAAAVADLPGVVHIERDILLQPTTDVGPEWIGAPGIWDGTTTTGLPGTKGEGVIAGILDSGINIDHPSFAATGDDGYTHDNPLGAGNYLGLCATEPATYTCNSKLIGIYDFTPQDGVDDADAAHGSHTASTVAGNVVYSPTIEAPTTSVTATEISGVAPHANIIAYDVCYSEGCPNSATMAAKEQAILDGVDVINYSIGGGGSNPWTDAGSMSWLNVRDAGVFASTSAGNAGPGAATMGSPGNSPWILTVGATTHNRKFLNALINMEGGDAPPDDIEGKSITSGYGPAPIVHARDYGDALCLEPFPAGTFDGEIVVCDRGEIARVGKGENVKAGGAGGYVLANDAANGMSINADAHVLPAVHITYPDAVKLRDWLTSTVVQTATIAGTTLGTDDDYGDIMAGFSSRGPNAEGTQVTGIIKPDVTAPGVDVFAATRSGVEYQSMGGTSMSSPHAAGAGALIRALHPDWTPAEIQSALTMTAWDEGILKEDESTPADPFDRGAGRVDLTAAGRAGLVLNETTPDYMAANPDEGGDPTTLNLATLGNDLCLQQCSWERTFRSTVDVATTYTAVVDAPPTMTVMVDPMTFTVPAYGTQVVEIEADVSAMPIEEWAFGTVSFETDADVPTFTPDWEEGFEGPYPPAGWASYALGDPEDPGFVTTTLAHTGDYGVAHFDDDLETSADSWLVTSQFTPTAQTEMAFWHLTVYDSYYDYHAVMVSEGSGDPADGDFVELAELDQGTGGTWQRMTQSLADYAGKPIYVAFRYQGDYADWWVIDDVLVGEMTGDAPISDLHMPLAVRPSTGVLPDSIDIQTRRNAGSQVAEDLQALEIIDLTIDHFGLTEAMVHEESLYGDPTNGNAYDFGTVPTGTFTVMKTVGADAKRLVAEITQSQAPDVDLFVGRDLDGDGPEASEQICASTTPSWGESCDIANPEAGDWWILVQNWQSSGSPPDMVTLASAVVPGTDANNMTVTGPTYVPEKEMFDLRLFWDEPEMEAGDRWYGAIAIGTDAAHPGNVGTIPVNLLRRQDDVTKSVSPTEAQPGDTVTYTIAIQPDITGQDLTYSIADTLPNGLTYVPGSATAGSGTLSVVGNRLTWSGKVLPPREYLPSTSLDDPLCTMPLANSGAYVDLEAFGFGTTPGVEGDGVAFQDSYPGGPFEFFGDPRTNSVYFTDDGFASLDLDSVLAGPVANAPIPTSDLPNALMAMFWNDMEIVYQEGTGESNRGATTGIYLTSDGVPSSKLLEFDDVQKVGDPSSQLDFELMLAEAVNDANGEYEVIFAYDNLTGTFTSPTMGTIGVESYDGLEGTQYAYNDAGLQTLEDGMAICFDYRIPDKPVEITYQATVDSDASGVLSNEVWHNTDNPGSRPEMLSADLMVANRVYLPLVFQDYSPPIEITVLHTNDEHGWLLPNVPFGSDVTEGGVASLMGRLTQNEGYSPDDDSFLLLSSGDNWTGPSISTWFEGEPVVEVMNAMGYDVSVIGNHEFDFGRDTLNQRIAEAEFPFLSANIYYSGTTDLADFVTPYVIQDVSGVDVGIVGLSTIKTPETTHPKNITDLTFGDYETALRREVPKMRADGADLIIVEAHVCSEELIPLADAVSDLDIALMEGGHCHETFTGEVGDTLILEGHWAWRAYGKTELSLDPFTYDVVDYTQDVVMNEYVTEEGNPVTPDPEIQGIVEEWEAEVDEEMGEVIGYTETGLPKESWKQANYVTDSWLWAYGTADFAMTNWGGLRADIPAGDITVGDIVGVLPFQNRIVDCEITGAEVIDNLECCGGAAIAGLTYTYYEEDGVRVVDAVTLTNGSPLVMTDTYSVLVNDFMYAGGDGFLFGDQDPDAYDTGIQWRQPVIDWTREQDTSEASPIDPLIDDEPRAIEITP